VVKPGEAKPVRKRAPKTIEQAAASDDPRELLVAMRTRLAKAVGDLNTPPRDLAALTRRLHEVVRDIAAIDAAAGEGDDLGEASRTPDEVFGSELTPDAL
jgi:hypothetical protein